MQLQVRLSKYGSRSKEEEEAPQRPHAQATPRSAAAPPRRVGGLAGGAQVGLRDGAVQELLAEKDQNISELRETVEILEIKIQKLEQLVRLKDSKIATLQGKLQKYEP